MISGDKNFGHAESLFLLFIRKNWNNTLGFEDEDDLFR